MNWFIFTLTAFAVFRLAHMFSKESGPARLFKKLRATTEPHSALREGISCLLCESIWWSAAATAWLVYSGKVPIGIAPFYWLAASGAAICLHFQFTKE